MLPIRFGDKGAIAIGGFGHIYAKMKENGGDLKAALKSFDRISVRTQQSTDIDQLSQLQRTSSLMRVFTRFMSSANALTRAEYNAIIDKSAGRISNKKFVKKMILFHVFIPGIIQFIANGVTWDSEDQLRASLLGTLNGIFLFKDVADALFRFGMGAKIFDIEGGHPMGFVDDMVRAMADFAENGIFWEDIVEGTRAIDGFLDGVGAITGIPAKTIANELRGVARTGSELAKGRTGDELTRGFAESMGYSTYTIDKKILAE
jgi:hypothetical protein